VIRNANSLKTTLSIDEAVVMMQAAPNALKGG